MTARFESIESCEAAAAKLHAAAPGLGVEIEMKRESRDGSTGQVLKYSMSATAGGGFGRLGVSATATNSATALFLPMNGAGYRGFEGEYGYEPSYAPRIVLVARCRGRNDERQFYAAAYSCGGFDITARQRAMSRLPRGCR